MNFKPQNEKRMLLLFAANGNERILSKQKQLLNTDTQGLQQRDIEVKIYTSTDVTVWKRNHIRGSFTAVLIGKDGGEKLRSHEPVTTKKLFAVIDAMPMRKEEMSHASGYE